MVFTKKKHVRFSHCDPAGIVFYPRYAELCNELVEDWFREGIGVDFHEFQESLRLSLPAVRLNCEFIRPSTYGEVLEFALRVVDIGRSSLNLSVLAWCGEQERVRVQLKLVLISLDSMRAVPIADDWRVRFAAFVE